ncbi:MAG: LysE family transporter [Bacteroidales bacterium]|nr:LysE family transporter [Bacteroidales bacterium]MDD3664470.1 LysE family transporter [Bacteroidales bacterium]
MTQALITISLIGLVAGFIFSMPVAGPISILVTSNALRGRLKYCIHAALGASIADLIYVFLAVLGLTELYNLYRPLIPYIMIVGAVFLFFLGLKIARTNLKIEENNLDAISTKGSTRNNGFITGFALNFLNPTLFLGWLTSSFLTISFVAYMGFNTGGLDQMLTKNVENINQTNVTDSTQLISTDYSFVKKAHQTPVTPPKVSAKASYPFIISAFYAVFLSLGSILWFYIFSVFLVKYRAKIKIQYLNLLVNGLGIFLCCFGILLAYKSFTSFLG